MSTATDARAEWREQLARVCFDAHVQLLKTRNPFWAGDSFDNQLGRTQEAFRVQSAAVQSAVYERLRPRLEHIRGLVAAGEQAEALRALGRVLEEVGP